MQFCGTRPGWKAGQTAFDRPRGRMSDPLAERTSRRHQQTDVQGHIAWSSARLSGVAVIVIALGVAWLFWSEYANLAAVSWWYDHTQSSRSRTKLPNPDY